VRPTILAPDVHRPDGGDGAHVAFRRGAGPTGDSIDDLKHSGTRPIAEPSSDPAAAFPSPTACRGAVDSLWNDITARYQAA
jgi:hypothetical protein